MTEAREVVGEISLGGTAFLLVAGTVLGMGGGLAYVALRRWLPRRGTGFIFGLLTLAGPAAFSWTLTNSTSFILGPSLLGVAMFASLPVLFGLLVVVLQARLEPFFTKSRSGPATALVLTAGLLPLAIGGPVVVALSILAGTGFLLARSSAVREWWGTNTVDIYGRAILGATGIFGLGLFAWGALEILV